MIRIIQTAASAVVLVIAFAAHGAELTTFEPGTPVRAADMNGNFVHLQDQIGVNTSAIAAQLESINAIELTPGPQGPQGEPGPAVADFLCGDGGGVQGFDDGLPICSRADNSCDANLEPNGWLWGCDHADGIFEDLNLVRSESSYVSFNNATVTSTMPLRPKTDNLPNAFDSSVRFAQNTFGLGSYVATDFRGAHLTDVNFYYAKLPIADFSDAIIDDSGTLREDGTVIRSNFHGTELSVADLSRSSFNYAFFFRSEGIALNFTDASLMNTAVLESNFYDTDFSGANMTDALFMAPAQFGQISSAPT